MGVFMLAEEVALEEVRAEFLWFSSANNHSTTAQTHLSSTKVCDSPDRAPQYYIFSL
jgi:hypothetical protein